MLWLLACTVLITIIMTDQIPEIHNKVRGDIRKMKAEDTKVRSEITRLKNKPFAFQCAWQDAWVTDNSVITYDRLTIDEISGGDGGLDINTGVFTVGDGLSGVWAVTYSFTSNQYRGTNEAWLYRNEGKIEESIHYTSYGGYGVMSLGSRVLYMRLESGDTISLRTGNVGYALNDVTLCFELAQFDYVPPM